jgi:hypothetical protein
MRKEIIAFALCLVAMLGMGSISLSTDVPISANVQGYLTATFNYSTIYYGTLTAGTSDNPAPDQATGIYNVSIDTNQNYKIATNGTQFDDGSGHTFPVSNLAMDTNSTAGDLAVVSAVALSGSPQDIDTYAYTEAVNYHGFWLSIPSTQFASNYTSTVAMTYSAV